MQMHIKELKDLGVDLEKQTKEHAKEPKQKKKPKPIEAIQK